MKQKKPKGDRFAADKVIAASLTGAAFGAMLIAVARGGERETTLAVQTGLQEAATADAAGGAPAAIVPTPVGQQATSPAQAAPLPRARRSRAS
ncbi:hypothetical protein HRbin29_00046 [bacterium HR29]|jgi:hypothetical protein|nr:hypothetical protein HRbin29_00046 [bacterium HR29]